MTLLSWIWFVAGTLTGSALLAAFAGLWAKACRRSSDRVRVIRLAHLGLIAVLFLQLFGWMPHLELREPKNPGAGAVATTAVGEVAPVELLTPEKGTAWPAMVWLSGTVIFAGLFLFRRLRLTRLRRLPVLADHAVRERLAGLAARLGFIRLPVTLTGRAGCSPFVFGVVRPVLVLPSDFGRLLSPAQQEAVLAHEFAHLVGRDPLWTTLGEAIAALLWWNPLSWWLVSKHHTASEAAADDATFVLADGPGLLAESLFVLAGRLAVIRLAPAPTLAVGSRCRSALVRRVRRLLTAAPAPVSQNRFIGLVRFGIACGIAVAVVSGMALTRVAGGENGSPLDLRLWVNDFVTPPLASQLTPRTLGDLHPDLRNDPRYAKLAAFKLAVIHQSVDASGSAKLPATETDAFNNINVTAEQREKLLALQARRWEETKAMYLGPVGERLARGLEINRRWRAGLEGVLTDSQYRRYLEFWRNRPVIAVQLPG